VVGGSVVDNFGSASNATAAVSVRGAGSSLSLDGLLFARNGLRGGGGGAAALSSDADGGGGRAVAAAQGAWLALKRCGFASHRTGDGRTSDGGGSGGGGSVWVGSGSSLWLESVNASGAHALRGPGGFLAASGGGSVTLRGLRATDNSAAGKTKIQTHPWLFFDLVCRSLLVEIRSSDLFFFVSNG
jgi:hypothetical protein